jgi:phage gpG-like protein
MSGLALVLKTQQLGVADDILRRLDPLDSATLLKGVGRLIQQQTRERIYSEKTSPTGQRWAPNRSGTSVLLRSRELVRSIDFAFSGQQVVVGSGLPYALIHQLGGTIEPKKAKRLVFRTGNGIVFAMKVQIPARPYLGVSEGNAADILAETARFIRRKLGL